MDFPWSKYPSFRTAEQRRRLVGIVMLAVAVAAAAGGGLIMWRSGYLQERSLRASREFFAAGDVRSALLMLQQTVQLYPDNVNARRMLAEYYLSVGSPAAVTAWKDVAALEPGNDSDLLSLAESALGFGNEAAAREALAAVGTEGRKTVGYHQVLAGLALARRDENALRSELAELQRLEPDNSRLQYNLAAVDAKSPDPARAAAARGRLEEMARGDTERIRATLQLVQLVRDRSYGATLAELVRRILPASAAVSGPPAAALAKHMKAQPAPNAADAADLIRWLAAQGLAKDALAWAAKLPEETAAARPVEMARAAVAIQDRDWPQLQSALRGGAWGPVRPDLLDAAFAAQEQRSGGETRALSAWEQNLARASGSLGSLRFLDNLAIALNWPGARDRVLWRMAREFPRETGAWRVLALGAEAKGDAAELGRIYQAWLASEPGNRAVEASALVLAVIRGDVTDEVRQRLGQVASQPGAAIEEVTAWAWVESQSGRRTEALRRLDAAPAPIRVSPRACLFYGAILAEAGRRPEARLYLQKAEGQPKLLPEEKRIIERARRLAGPGI
jgi:hypothetical protein